MIENIAQLFLNGIGIGSIIALGAVGLTIVYRVAGFANFAHPEFMTLGAYFGLIFQSISGSLLVGVIASAITVAIIAVILDQTLWKPARHKWGGDPLLLMIIAVAVGLFLRGLIIFIWGNRPLSFDIPIYHDLTFAGLGMSIFHLTAIGLAGISMLVVYWILNHTEIGTGMRAVGDNEELAQISGFSINRIIIFTWAISAVIAAFGGIIYGMMTVVNPIFGFRLFLPIFAAVIVGRVGNPYGAMLGGYFVGIAQETSVILLPHEYKTGVSLIIIVLALVIRFRGGERV